MKVTRQISLLFILLFSLTSSPAVAGDTLNSYVRITQLFNANGEDPDSFRIASEDIGILKANDTIVIYQAKGVEWDTVYGDCTGTYRYTGRFEFHVVLKVVSGDIIVLPSSLNFDTIGVGMYLRYNSDYFMQAVKVASYKNLTATKDLVAGPWDSKKGKGGIFAMMVDTLDLKSYNIDASAKGFKGGNPVSNASNLACASSCPTCDTNNYTYWEKDRSGLKGESVCVFDSIRMRGRLPLYNGGGGGNGYYAGGGGGSNYGNGGEGGYEAAICSPYNYSSRGQPGFAIDGGLLSKSGFRAVFGGGGGCSVIKSPAVATKGGDGGGIVLLVANVLKSSSGQIMANGESVTTTSTAGGGGGGGGGSIFMDINQFSGNLTLSVQGGKGGNTTGSDTAGPGGGGGAGYIYFNGTSLPAAITVGINELKGGAKGTNLRSNSNKSNPGNSGNKMGNLIMPIKDVLFNVMPADQKICAGKKPKRFNASHPKGGNGVYRYIWVRSKNKIAWDTISNNNDSIMYQDSVLHDTTFYKRIVMSTVNGETFTDISTILTVDVLPAIENNLISILGHDTLCYGIPFPKLSGTKITKGGDGNYVYRWQENFSGWQDAPPVNDTIGYLSTRSVTTKFRRIVISGSAVCKDTSNVVIIKVLDTITNNIVGDTQWIPMGDTAHYLRSKKTVAGGDGIYRYLWQEREVTSTLWDTAANVYTNSTYIVPSIVDTFYYKRTVFSGENNTCSSTSNVVAIYMLDSLVNNTISGTQTICGATRPNDFIGTLPHGGDRKYYYYKWEQSLNGTTWDSIAFITNSNDTIFNPGIINPGASVHITIYVYFRRIAMSGGPNHNCCIDTSNTIVLTVRPYIKNNIITNSDTIICYNQKPDSIMANQPIDGDGPYSYKWQDSLNNINWTVISGATNPHYGSSALHDTTYFRRKVTSGICISYSNNFKVTVLDTLGNNIITSESNYVCSGSRPAILNGQVPTGGEGHIYSYYWQKSINNSSWSNAPNSVVTDTSYHPDTTTIKLYFRRIVKSGLHDCCIDTSAVFIINIHELPTDSVTIFNDSLCLDSTYIIHHVLTGQPDFRIDFTDGINNYDTTGVDVFEFDQPFKPKNANIYNYRVTSVTDGNNCIAKKIVGSGILSVFNIPEADIAGTKDSICELVVKLSAHPSYGTGIWKSYDGMTFDNYLNSATSATAPGYGQYSVTWFENNGGCKDSASIKISFFEQPKQSEVITGEDQEGPFKFRTTLDATTPSVGNGIWTSTDNSIYIVDPSNPKTFVDSLKFGINKFIWTITNGACTPVWDTMEVITRDIKVPHGMSPNFDNINDTFVIKGLEYTKNAELTIINKWGGVVYQSGDYRNDWTGIYKGNALPEDTYFYILRVINRTYKGFLVIRR